MKFLPHENRLANKLFQIRLVQKSAGAELAETGNADRQAPEWAELEVAEPVWAESSHRSGRSLLPQLAVPLEVVVVVDHFVAVLAVWTCSFPASRRRSIFILRYLKNTAKSILAIYVTFSIFVPKIRLLSSYGFLWHKDSRDFFLWLFFPVGIRNTYFPIIGYRFF